VRLPRRRFGQLDYVSYETIFTDQEWSLLVGLPQAVMSAASAVEKNSARQTLVEGEAGLDAVADGRQSGNPLVEAVATELVFRVGGDPDLGEEPPIVVVPDDAATYVAETLRRAKAARTLLAEKVGEGDAGAYRHWLVMIAAQVVEAAPTGGVFGIGGEQVSPSEGRFVHQLAAALDD
jgi:capsid protein